MVATHAWLAGAQVGADASEGDYLVLEVSDSGEGMDAATLSRLFDPFYSTKGPGRGLGLAAVLGIVRGHRGAVRISSTPDQGSTATVLLPAASEGQAATAPTAAVHLTAPLAASSAWTVPASVVT